MPRRYPPEVRRQVIELARSGTRVKQLAATFAISEATVYNWIKQDRIDRGEIEGLKSSRVKWCSSLVGGGFSGSGCGGELVHLL